MRSSKVHNAIITFCSYDHLGRVNFAPVFWDNLKEAKEFVSGLLKADPKERMTAAQALKHPWLKVEDVLDFFFSDLN